MRHVKIANIADLHEQFTWAYNAIASKLAKNIDSFDENITIMTFLKNLKIKKNTWHRIYNRKFNSSRTESEFSQYQINFSNSFFLEYEQTIYTQKQYRSSFENVSEQRSYQRFQTSDNIFLKDKISVRIQNIFEKYNQQNRAANITLDQIQFTTFETQSIRNQAIFAWRQNVSQENISDQIQNQSAANSADATSVENRTSLERYNNDERKQYQNQEKRDQFRKFYENKR
jgi:hypothetical protein